MQTPTDGTVTPYGTAATREAMLDAVREANGRRAIRPAVTVDAAALDVESFLIVPAWAEGQSAAAVAAETLAAVHGVDVTDPRSASAHPFAWLLYAEGARRLGFPGPVPVPTQAFGETGAQARA